jgi:hypothetical protein
MLRDVQPWRVHEDDLHTFRGENAKLRAPRRLWTRGHGCDFLSEKGVDESGFSNIGASDDGDKSRMEGIAHGFSSGEMQIGFP